MINSLLSPHSRRAPVPLADTSRTLLDENERATTPPGDAAPNNGDDAERHARLNAADGIITAVLAAVVIALLVALRPFANVPMNDDFSYARTAEALARTGHIVYNGWGSPLLWPQMAYGALVVKIWGFSWTHLAVTGVVLAGVVAGLFYLLLRACRITAPVAALGVAALTLNPIYLCVAPSFMTDIPSLALLLAPLLLLVRAVRRDAQNGALTLHAGRYLVASVLAIVAGSNRQISWVAFLGAQVALFALLPATERKKILLGIGVLLDGAIIANYWFALQPYTINVDMQEGVRQLVKWPQATIVHVSRFLNLMGLLILPLALLAAPGVVKDKKSEEGDSDAQRSGFLSLILHPLCLTTLFWFATVVIPWRERFPLPRYGVFVYSQYVTSRGVLIGGTPGYSRRPVALPDPLVYAMLLGGAFALAVVTLLTIRWARTAWAAARRGEGELPVARVAALALMAATVIQIIASVPWYSQIFIFDRYLLLLLPGPLALLGVQASQTMRAPFPALSAFAGAAPPAGRVKRVKGVQIAALAAAAFTATLGVLFAQEYFGYTHARAKLYRYLTDRGVRPQQINGGFEMDADAQVQARGYINNPFLVDPKGAFQPNRKAAHISLMPEYFPDVDPFYRLTTDGIVEPTEDIFPAPVCLTRYRAWLPPFERTMYVYRVKR